MATETMSADVGMDQQPFNASPLASGGSATAAMTTSLSASPSQLSLQGGPYHSASASGSPLMNSPSVDDIANHFRVLQSSSVPVLYPFGQSSLLNPQAYPLMVPPPFGLMIPGDPLFASDPRKFTINSMMRDRMMYDPTSNRFVGKQMNFFHPDNSFTARRHIRHRRSFKELVRDVMCPHENCGRRYATRSSLATHVRLKHGGDMSLINPKDLAGTDSSLSFNDEYAQNDSEREDPETPGSERRESCRVRFEDAESDIEADRKEANVGENATHPQTNPFGALKMKKKLLEKFEDDIRPRAYSSGAQLQTPTENQIHADMQLFDVLSVDDLALLASNDDAALVDMLELTPHTSIESNKKVSTPTERQQAATPEASLPSTRGTTPAVSPAVLQKHKPIAPNMIPHMSMMTASASYMAAAQHMYPMYLSPHTTFNGAGAAENSLLSPNLTTLSTNFGGLAPFDSSIAASLDQLEAELNCKFPCPSSPSLLKAQDSMMTRKGTKTSTDDEDLTVAEIFEELKALCDSADTF